MRRCWVLPSYPEDQQLWMACLIDMCSLSTNVKPLLLDENDQRVAASEDDRQASVSVLLELLR